MMDNSEFEMRAFANPDDNAPDFMEALAARPDRQQLLDEIRSFNGRLETVTQAITAPAGLDARLKVLPADQAGESAADSGTNIIRLPRAWQPLRLGAMAAALVLAVGITYSTLFNGAQPSAGELEFGQQIVAHVYTEQDDIDARTGVSYQVVSEVVSALGGAVSSDAALERLRVSFAKPCAIFPSSNSVHLVLEGNSGAVNVIVIDNSPVSREFSFSQ